MTSYSAQFTGLVAERRRVLSYTGRAGDLVPTLRAWTPDPNLPISDVNATYLQPLTSETICGEATPR